MIHGVCLLLAVAAQDQTVVPSSNSKSPGESIALDEAAPCARETAAIEQIGSKYQAEEDQIAADGDAMEKKYKDSPHVTFDVTFKTQRYTFGMPQVSMKPVRIALNVPAVTMKQHGITTKVPVNGWREEIIGWRPVCKNLHCKMKKITTKVPTVTMENRSISTSTPEVSMRHTEVVTNLPKVKLKQVTWILKIPEFKLRSPIKTEEPPPGEGEELQKRGDALAAKIQADSSTAQAALNACLATDISLKRNKVAAYYDAGIAQFNAAIDTFQKNGIDPRNVDTDDGAMNYVAARDNLAKERAKALGELDSAMAKLKLEEAGPDEA